eukprot:3542782-Rhodomonas_salina.1
MEQRAETERNLGGGVGAQGAGLTAISDVHGAWEQDSRTVVKEGTWGAGLALEGLCGEDPSWYPPETPVSGLAVYGDGQSGTRKCACVSTCKASDQDMKKKNALQQERRQGRSGSICVEQPDLVHSSRRPKGPSMTALRPATLFHARLV